MLAMVIENKHKRQKQEMVGTRKLERCEHLTQYINS